MRVRESTKDVSRPSVMKEGEERATEIDSSIEQYREHLFQVNEQKRKEER